MALVRQLAGRSTLAARDHSRAAFASAGTRGALRDRMRSSIIAALLLVGSSTALAGSGGGGPPPGRGEGSGRLGRVSGGLGDATGGGKDQRPAPTPRDTVYGDPDYHGMYRYERDGADIVVIDTDDHLVRRIQPKVEPRRQAASIDLYIGVQKVVESDTSASLTAAIRDDWFRLAGNVTRYWEDRMDGEGRLTLTMPSLTLGLPVQQGGETHAYIEGGVVYVKTANDPVVDTSITGGKLGLHLETPIVSTKFVGDAHVLVFSDNVYALEARVGVRWGKLEAAIRALDFNVGPTLYGPEVGVAF